MIFCFILIDFCDYFGFRFMTLNRNPVSICTRLVFEKFICAYLHQFVREIIRLLVNNLHEKRITWSQDERNFASTRTVFVIWTHVTRKMHSFSANPTRVIFSCILSKWLQHGNSLEGDEQSMDSAWKLSLPVTVLLLIHCDLEYADHHNEVSMTCSAPDLFHSEVSCKRISLLKLYFVRDKKNSILELSF